MERLTDEFATDVFIELNRDFYDRYVEMRVHGYSAHPAYLKVFGADNWPGQKAGFARLDAIESTLYFQEQFETRLAEIKVAELWDVKKPLNELLTQVRGPYVK